jgi:hypothetical protein
MTPRPSCKTSIAIALVLCVVSIVFCNWPGYDSSPTTTTWTFSPSATSPNGAYVVGRVTEPNRHDTRDALAIAELLPDRGAAAWVTVYPFDALNWRSVKWDGDKRLLVDGWDLTEGRHGGTTRVDEFGIEVDLHEIAPPRE